MSVFDRRHIQSCTRGILAAAALLVSLGLPARVVAQDIGKGVVGGYSMEECHKAAELGVGAYRLGFVWYSMQPSPGQTIDFSGHDQFIQCLRSNHINRILATMAYAPVWAGGNNTDQPSRMPDMNAWRAFVRQVVDHYYPMLGNDIVFGVWNEPDGNFLVHNGATTSQYSELFVYASLGRDDVYPAARLGALEFGSNSPSTVGSFYTAVSPYLKAQDVVTVHWYPQNSRSLPTYMSDVLQRVGQRETWLSETGFNTCDPNARADAIRSIDTAFYNRSSSAWAAYFIYQLRIDSPCSETLLQPGTWNNTVAFTTYQTLIHVEGRRVGGQAIKVAGCTGQITSYNGLYTLISQCDGNLVLYGPSGPVWATMTFSAPGYSIMQTDGNFVLFDGAGTPTFSTGTGGNPGALLQLGDDGVLRVLMGGPGGFATLWASNSAPSQQDPTFAEHIDYAGASVQWSQDQSFVGWDWNDRISSVRVPAGWTVILYEHADYGGATLTLTSDVPDLRNFAGPGADGTWNDAASSIRIIR